MFATQPPPDLPLAEPQDLSRLRDAESVIHDGLHGLEAVLVFHRQ
jgi:hypothetical protein